MLLVFFVVACVAAVAVDAAVALTVVVVMVAFVNHRRCRRPSLVSPTFYCLHERAKTRIQMGAPVAAVSPSGNVYIYIYIISIDT